jgi:hypothetical protein
MDASCDPADDHVLDAVAAEAVDQPDEIEIAQRLTLSAIRACSRATNARSSSADAG